MGKTQQNGYFDDELRRYDALKRKPNSKYAWVYHDRMSSALAIDFTDAIEDIWAYFLKYKKTLSTVESCTGGLVAKLITDRSGASNFFTHGFVTYSPQAKIDLGVDASTIKVHSVYSSECAIEMVRAASVRSKSDFVIATTGVAGPTDDGEVKAGTVTIAVQFSPNEYTVQKYVFPGDRDQVRQFAAMTGIVMLARAISRLDK